MSSETDVRAACTAFLCVQVDDDERGRIGRVGGVVVVVVVVVLFKPRLALKKACLENQSIDNTGR